MNHNFIKPKLINSDLIIESTEINHGSKVADFGCGQLGYFAFALARIVGEKGVVYAIDVINNHLEGIKKEANKLNLKQIKTIWADLEVLNSTKIKPNELDAVLIINVLSQSTKPSEIIKEGLRVLKENGKLVIVDWEKISPFGGDLEKRIDKNNLVKKLPNFGLNLEKEFKAGPHNYGLVFNKL